MPPNTQAKAEITLRNLPDAEEVAGLLAHILTDLHEALSLLTKQGALLAKHDALLDEFRPMIEAYRRTNGGTIGLLKARKGLRNGS